ncbi:MAG: iron-sulfur cluster assembly scaffold protein [Chloroflexota bacterium]
MPVPYSDIVMDHFRDPRNVGRIENPDAKAVEGSAACGDMVAVYLMVDAEQLRISDVKFESYGCASNIATASIITEMAKGKTLDEVKNLTWQQISEALGGLPALKVHCSVLAIDSLRAAVENYEERHGLIKERVPTTEIIVMKRLKRVMNPMVGLDLVRTKLVSEIDITEGNVSVTIDLPSDHQFAANIREEIIEKIEPLWDIKQVTVQFKDEAPFPLPMIT